MRRYVLAATLCLAFVFIPIVALAAPPVAKLDTAVALTGTACTSLSSATDGADLTNAAGWRVIASAPSSQTFTGGSAVCCFRSATLARWMDCNTALNLTLTSGKRDVATPDYATYVGLGRIKYLGSAITLSGGSTITITYEVNQK